MTYRERGKLPGLPQHLKLDTSSLLNGGLLALLLLGYVILVYVTVLAIGSSLIGVNLAEPDSMTPWWLDGIAFGVIALGFLPVSRWLSVRVNDLVYGEHDDPYSLISRVNRHLQAMMNPALTLPHLLEAIAEELRLPYVAIQTSGTEPTLYYETGIRPEGNTLIRLPILYLDQQIGLLITSTRKGARPLSASDLHLLRDTAGSMGVALHAARLTAELQISREQLVMVREEERRRIRNDLHDGLGPTLSSLQLQLGAIRRLIHVDPTEADKMVEDIGEDLQKTTAEIRQLVYDLRPPMLDELGLVEALKNSVMPKGDIHFEMIAPDPMPHLATAVEVAAFRITSEAVHNVIKHANATQCTISIDVSENALTILIVDNGQGMSEGMLAGVGLNTMKERAEELGGSLFIEDHPDGGTQLVARLPNGGSQQWKSSLL